MKCILCDNAGYSNYTHKLCNAMVNVSDGNITYLTDKNNPDLDEVKTCISIKPVISAYNKNYKRGSFKWLADRATLPYRILLSRNKAIRKEKAEVVFLQAYMPLFDQFLISGLEKHAKIILTVHNVIPHEKSYNWSYQSLRRVYQKADHLIVHTMENRDELINDFSIEKEKITVINHGTDIDYKKIDYTECRNKLGVSDCAPVLLLYGGIRDYKGLDILIPALANTNCHLVIAGALQNGLSFAPYQKMIEEFGIDAKCYIERVSEEFTDVLFQASDFVVFPYKEFHSQSGVFMQAIKYGKHVIATDVGSFRSFVEQYDLGYICNPNNVDSLHECINNAIEGMASLKDISDLSKLFSWETSAEEYIGVANEILE